MALFSQNGWLKITVRLALFFRASGSLVSEFTLWTYVSSEDIEVDRTPPVFMAGKTAFSGAKKQTIKTGEADVSAYVTNGPTQEYELY